MADEAGAAGGVKPHLAAAIMLLRDMAAGQGIEVFMVRRVIQSDFMPDVYVFPGGSVCADDRAAESAEDVCTPLAPDLSLGLSLPGGQGKGADPEGRTSLGSGVRAAAIRELFEEAGVLLAYRAGEILALGAQDVARFDSYRQALNQRTGSLVKMARAEDLRLATDELGYFAHWITPAGMPKRFDTHFFITAAPAEQQAAYDHLETSEGLWVAPSEALARSERGEFPLVFATIHQLHELGTFGSVREAIASTSLRYVEPRMPILVEGDDGVRVHLPGDDVNAWEVPARMTRLP
jgi:8-oxo-dGTP pyrophosphatase MutT (NUDIX family)